jgi:hypothetical protein
LDALAGTSNALSSTRGELAGLGEAARGALVIGAAAIEASEPRVWTAAVCGARELNLTPRMNPPAAHASNANTFPTNPKRICLFSFTVCVRLFYGKSRDDSDKKRRPPSKAACLSAESAELALVMPQAQPSLLPPLHSRLPDCNTGSTAAIGAPTD